MTLSSYAPPAYRYCDVGWRPINDGQRTRDVLCIIIAPPEPPRVRHLRNIICEGEALYLWTADDMRALVGS